MSPLTIARETIVINQSPSSACDCYFSALWKLQYVVCDMMISLKINFFSVLSCCTLLLTPALDVNEYIHLQILQVFLVCSLAHAYRVFEIHTSVYYNKSRYDAVRERGVAARRGVLRMNTLLS